MNLVEQSEISFFIFSENKTSPIPLERTSIMANMIQSIVRNPGTSIAASLISAITISPCGKLRKFRIFLEFEKF